MEYFKILLTDQMSHQARKKIFDLLEGHGHAYKTWFRTGKYGRAHFIVTNKEAVALMTLMYNEFIKHVAVAPCAFETPQEKWERDYPGITYGDYKMKSVKEMQSFFEEISR